MDADLDETTCALLRLKLAALALIISLTLLAHPIFKYFPTFPLSKFLQLKMFKKAAISLLNLLLYGHFWIAAAALVMALQTRFLLWGDCTLTALEGFVTGGTLTIYALHRLVALRLQPQIEQSDRFAIMQLFRHHILFYALVAGLVAAYFYFQLAFALQVSLLLPCAIALGYVLPLLNGQRLRDLPYLKIFLIAFAWSWITVFGPVYQQGVVFSWPVVLMLFERACFVFAITIPFDIRDLALDQSAKVPTLPASWGTQLAKRMAYLALGISLVCIVGNFLLGTYSWPILLAFGLSIASTAYLIRLTHPDRHDYFFTGLLDGTMVFQGLLVAGASWM